MNAQQYKRVYGCQIDGYIVKLQKIVYITSSLNDTAVYL